MPRLTIVADALVHSKDFLGKKARHHDVKSATSLVDSWSSSATNHVAPMSPEDPSVDDGHNLTYGFNTPTSVAVVPYWTHNPYLTNGWSVLPVMMPTARRCYEESHLSTNEPSERRMVYANTSYTTQVIPHRALQPQQQSRINTQAFYPSSFTPSYMNAEYEEQDMEEPCFEDTEAPLPRIRRTLRRYLHKGPLRPVQTFPLPHPGDVVYRYRVSHKRRSTVAWSPVEYPLGSVLVVDGDQGYDIGEVIDAKQFICRKLSDVPDAKAYRPATQEELNFCLDATKTIENKTLEYLKELAVLANNGKLRNDPIHSTYETEISVMNVIDCELQADHQKLYVYFTAARQITFCHITRSLFRLFQCRVWLQQTNLNTSFVSSANTSTDTQSGKKAPKKKDDPGALSHFDGGIVQQPTPQLW